MVKKIKIAYVTTEFVSEQNFDGGLANYLGKVTNYLKDAGHFPVVFTLSDRDEYIEYNGIPVYRVRSSDLFKDDFKDYFERKLDYLGTCLFDAQKLTNRVEKYLEEEGIVDIVQFSSYRATGIFSEQLKSKFDIIPIVRISSYERRYRSIQGRDLRLDYQLAFELEERAMKSVDAVFSPSELVGNELSTILNKNVEIIRTPYIKSEGQFSTDQNSNLGKYLLFFGTLNKIKGVELLRKALPDLLKKYSEFKFIFAGKDEGQLKLFESEFNIEERKRLVFTGRLEKDELYKYIKNAHGVVLPSLYDNLPNTLIESMSMGKLILVSSQSSLDELIQNNKNGFVFKNGDVKDLKSKLEKLWNISDAEKKKFENAVQDFVEENLAPHIVVPQLISYYYNLINLNNNKSIN